MAYESWVAVGMFCASVWIRDGSGEKISNILDDPVANSVKEKEKTPA
jgi:hypothetical protein